MNKDDEIIMYHKVFRMHKLSVSERLVYSYLIGQADISQCGLNAPSEFDSHSKLKTENREDYEWREINIENDARIGRGAGLTRMGARKARLGLVAKNVIKDGRIYAPSEILSKGYTKLFTETGLQNELLLYYTWYYLYSECHGLQDFTSEGKLAEFYFGDKSKIGKIRWYMQRLEHEGLIYRDYNVSRKFGIVKFKFRHETYRGETKQYINVNETIQNVNETIDPIPF